MSVRERERERERGREREREGGKKNNKQNITNCEKSKSKCEKWGECRGGGGGVRGGGGEKDTECHAGN